MFFDEPVEITDPVRRIDLIKVGELRSVQLMAENSTPVVLPQTVIQSGPIQEKYPMPSKLVVITWDEASMNVPGQGLPGGPLFPSNSLPGGPNYPSQGLPGGGHISLLPVYPFDPTLPDAGLPPTGGTPGNDLPRPGKKYVVKWLACSGLILVPDNSLPGGSGSIDNSLPETGSPK